MAPAMSRQQRRAAEREGRQYYERHGVPPGGDPMPLILHTRRLIAILSDPDNPARASEAADATFASLGRAARRHPPETAPACLRGCAFCCHDIVGATAPEVFRLARLVSGLPEPQRGAALRRIEAAHQRTAGATPEERLRDRRPCAMLEGGACSGYAARPLVCRAANSSDARACEAAFQSGAGPVPAARLPFLLRDAHWVGLLAALQAARLPTQAYELNHALWLALGTPDAEARWLAGEDLFAPVQTTPAPHARHQAFVQTLIADARGGD